MVWSGFSVNNGNAWFHKYSNEFTVNRCPPVTRSLKNRHLGFSGTGDLNKIYRNYVVLLCQQKPKSLRHLFDTLLDVLLKKKTVPTVSVFDFTCIIVTRYE